VECYRDSGDFVYVLCDSFRESDIVCRGIEALMDLLWREHASWELERGVGIMEVSRDD
jgi:hypothetical protein